MLRLFAIGLLLAGTSDRPAQQITTGSQGVAGAAIRNLGSPTWDAGLLIRMDGFYLGGPAAYVPARPFTPGRTATADKFGVRAWAENGKARIVVYALLADRRAPEGEVETPIASLLLTVGQSVEILETEKWGAAHVVVGAIPGSALH